MKLKFVSRGGRSRERERERGGGEGGGRKRENRERIVGEKKKNRGLEIM